MHLLSDLSAPRAPRGRHAHHEPVIMCKMWASIGRVTGRLLFFLFGLHVPCAARERGSGPERSRMRDFLSRSIFPLGFLFNLFGYLEMVIVAYYCAE